MTQNGQFINNWRLFGSCFWRLVILTFREMDIVRYACHQSTWEAGGQRVTGRVHSHPKLHDKIDSSLDYMRPCIKQTNKPMNKQWQNLVSTFFCIVLLQKALHSWERAWMGARVHLVNYPHSQGSNINPFTKVEASRFNPLVKPHLSAEFH